MTAIRWGGAAEGRHRDDRAASGQSKQAAHARSAKVKPLHATLARRALLRLDSMAAPDPHSMGVPRPEFPRLCPACLPRYPLQTILRQVLATVAQPCGYPVDGQMDCLHPTRSSVSGKFVSNGRNRVAPHHGYRYSRGARRVFRRRKATTSVRIFT